MSIDETEEGPDDTELGDATPKEKTSMRRTKDDEPNNGSTKVPTDGNAAPEAKEG